MKRFLYFAFCGLTLLTGLALGRYVWEAPPNDVKVLAPPVVASRQPARSGNLTLEKALREVNSGPRRAALLTVLSARQDRRTLRALVNSCGHDPASFAFLAEIWQELDPAAFFRCAISSPVVTEVHAQANLGALSRVIQKLAKTDRDAAWRETERLPAKFRRVFTRAVTLDLLKTDPRRALEAALEHPGSTPGYLRGSPPLNPDLLPLVQRLPDSVAKATMLENIASREPFAEAMRIVSGPGEADSFARDGLVKDTLENEPDEVIAWVDQAEGNSRYRAAGQVGEYLAAKDPTAALEWAEMHLSGDSRVRVIREAAARLGAVDSAAAERARALLPENFSRLPANSSPQ